ncbi:MAG: YbaB/EbfC family nucleoid-associated protein [Actinomycetota bacterium]|nr:YbaB/EbfC family nucleoid-associated protein [Actinomycetota bacterium]
MTDWADRQAAAAEQKVQRIKEIQAELRAVEVSGSSPEGSVTATVTGQGQLRSVHISPKAFGRADAPALGRAVVAAIMAANTAATALSREKLADVIDLGAVDSLMSSLFED